MTAPDARKRPSTTTAATAPTPGSRAYQPSESGRVLPCWLCLGLGGIAVHLKWTRARVEAQSDSYPLWTAHEYPSQDAHDVRPCPACPGSVHAHAARAYCHVACTPTSHDDACAWFGTDEPRPARLPGLIDPSDNGSRTPCSRCGVPLRFIENLLTVCLRCEPLSDHEPVVRAQCWAKPPRQYQQQLCQMTKGHAGPHQTYDGVIWPSDPSGNDSSPLTEASDGKGSLAVDEVGA